VRNLGHGWREHVAWAAPFRPEIHHYRLRITGRQNLGFEISIGC